MTTAAAARYTASVAKAKGKGMAVFNQNCILITHAAFLYVHMHIIYIYVHIQECTRCAYICVYVSGVRGYHNLVTSSRPKLYRGVDEIAIDVPVLYSVAVTGGKYTPSVHVVPVKRNETRKEKLSARILRN